MNSRMGVYPSMITHKDQEIDQANRKSSKGSDELNDGSKPRCKIVTNIRHRMSPNKILWDMLNDDAMKNTYRASMNTC